MSLPSLYQGMTLEQWQTEVATLQAARDRILRSQEYQVGDGATARRNQRAAYDKVSADLASARAAVARLQTCSTGWAARSIVPR